MIEYECGCIVDPERQCKDLPFAVKTCDVAAKIAQSMPPILVNCLETDYWWSHFKHGKIKETSPNGMATVC